MYLEAAFIELRSALNANEFTRDDRGRVLALVRQAHARAPQRYREQWLPYLRGFEHLWRDPCWEMRDIQALREGMRLFPFARFDYALNYRAWRKIRDMSEGWRAHVTRLNLSSSGVGGEHLERLCEQPPFPALRVLEARGNNLSPEDTRRLLLWADGSGVREVDLSHNKIDGGIVGVFAGLTMRTSIERLDLSRNSRLHSECLMRLASQAWPSLRVLDVRGCEVGEAWIHPMLRSPHIPALQRISLSAYQLSEPFKRALAQWPEARLDVIGM